MTSKARSRITLWAFCGVVACLTPLAASAAVVTFDDGTRGWNASGHDHISDTGGNPGAYIDTMFNNMGMFIHSETDTDFQGDFSQSGPLRLSIDIRVDDLYYYVTPVTRKLAVEIRDFDESNPGVYCSVWKEIGTLTPAVNDWQTYSAIIDDPSSTELPEGWGGTGSGYLTLPEGRTFASVMANADEISFTTYLPGYFYSTAVYDVGIDNITIESVPEPGMLGMFLLGIGAVIRRR